MTVQYMLIKGGDHHKLKIIGRDNQLKIGKVGEAVHMLGNVNHVSRPTTDMNSKWEPVIMKHA